MRVNNMLRYLQLTGGILLGLMSTYLISTGKATTITYVNLFLSGWNIGLGLRG